MAEFELKILQMSVDLYIDENSIISFLARLFNLKKSEIATHDKYFTQRLNSGDIKIGYKMDYSHLKDKTMLHIALLTGVTYDWCELVLSAYLAYEFNSNVLTSAMMVEHAILLLVCPNGQVHRSWELYEDCVDYDFLAESDSWSEFYLDLIKEYYPDFEDEEVFFNSPSLYILKT